MEVKIIKEITVESKHFKFKVRNSDKNYQLIIPEYDTDNYSKFNHALVFWNYNGDSGSVWYTLDAVKRNINDGFWTVTEVLD